MGRVGENRGAGAPSAAGRVVSVFRQVGQISVILSSPGGLLHLPQPTERTHEHGDAKQVAFNCILGELGIAGYSACSLHDVEFAELGHRRDVAPATYCHCVGRWVKRSFFDSRKCGIQLSECLNEPFQVQWVGVRNEVQVLSPTNVTVGGDRYTPDHDEAHPVIAKCGKERAKVEPNQRFWAAPLMALICMQSACRRASRSLIGAPRSASMRIDRARRRRSVSSLVLEAISPSLVRRSIGRLGFGTFTRGVLVLIAFAALWLTTPARAAPRPSGGTTAKHGKSAQARSAPSTPSSQGAQLLSPDSVGVDTEARELGATGQVDPLSGLGIRDPVCDQLAQIRSRETRLACETGGTPESNYPASNYGFDIFISTGITHPIGDILYGFATVLNGIWLGLIFVLKLVLELLGLAFGLNPFSSGQTMSHISAALGRVYAGITDPWLSATVVAGGIWFAYRGLLRRELAAGVAGTLAGIAMLIVGLWVIHQPRESVGQLAGLSDEVALAAISSPQSGSVSRPSGTYAETMSSTWSRLVEVPFAGLDFSDVKWALGPPPAEAVQKSNEKFCADFGALALLAVLSNLGNTQAKEACAGFARKRYGRPKSVIDLYLRSSPGSPAREALWSYFNGDQLYKAKVAAQGGNGVLTRLSMLALFAIALAGAILLLAWLAIRLFSQAAIAFVLLLAAPFALFFPLLGDSGRRAFKTWGLTLLGATVAKVIYAAFLSVVLLGISILGQVDGAAGSATGFLLSAAFSWAVFLKRAQLIDWMSIGEADRHAGHGLSVAGLAAFSIARRISGSGSNTVKGVGRRGWHLARTRLADGGAATRETANDSLQSSARALADQRYQEAKGTLAEAGPQEAERGSKRSIKTLRSSTNEKGAKVGTAPAKESPSERPGADRKRDAPGERFERAEALVAHVAHNQRRLGERWSERDLRRFAGEDRELLLRSKDPADHAHRAGYDRAQFEALRGPDRDAAEAAIEKATKRDRQRLDVAGSIPGRVIGRPRQAAEGLRQRREGANPERLEQLRRLRRDRHLASHPEQRRNLSRGG